MMDGKLIVATVISTILTVSLSTKNVWAANESNSSPPDSGLQEIVVTAQRRAQNAQDIPLSISAFSGDSLADRGVISTEDLQKVTPGLQFGSASIERNELYLRGIGSDRFDAAGESSSGVFVDDIYQPRFSNLLLDLLDVERVEVLKGPQGTLYGRNTIGGAIAVYTPVPSDNPHVTARTDIGTQNLFGAMGSVSGPLTDSLDGSLSVGYRRRDGFMRDSVSGQTNGIDSSGARLKLLYKPIENLTMTLIGSTFDTTQNAVLLARGGSGVYLLSPIIPNPGPIGNPYDSAYSTPGGATNSTRSSSVKVQYDAPDITLTSISAYQFSHDKNSEDGDSSPYDAFNYSGGITSHAFSQEFRVNSVNSGALSAGGHLTWVGGLYFFHENVTEPYTFRLGDQSVFAFLAGPLFPAAGILDDLDRSLGTRSYAGFGQATYAFTDGLDVTLGGRYSYDKKSVLANGTTNLPGFPLVVAPFSVPASDSWGKFTPRISIDYKLTDQVMAYATWAEGYKSGAAQSVSFDPRLAGRLVSPETVNGYEVGVKSELLDRTLRLNGAVFYNKFKDLQVRSIVNLGSGVAEPAIENAASSSIRGVEVTATWIPFKELTIDLGYNYLDAYYGRFIADAVPGSVQDDSGNTMPRSPRNTINAAARYDIPLPNNRNIAFSAASYYTSPQFFQPDDTPLVRQGGYTTTDFSVTYGLADGRLQLTGWVKNAFDKEYEVYAEEDAPEVREAWADKRSAGITARYHF